jgi:predicted Rossmann fold nucleotide-binding protein DprA/Smf involved in DNA uptake
MTAADVALRLTNRISPVAVEPLKAKEFWKIRSIDDFESLLGAPATDIGVRVGDPVMGERIAALLDAATGFTVAREGLESKGIRLLSPGDGVYPDRIPSALGAAAPPMLYGAGPLAWLDQTLIGVVGSRAVDEDGADVARGVAEAAGRCHAGIVSGAAKGVDLLAMDAAYRAELPVVGVTSEGLERASGRKELRGAVGEERLCLITPYAPEAGFSVGNAMGRNKLIYGLATVTLVVASDLDSGGTWGGATEALRRGFGRVAVWTGAGAGPGNAALVERGGEAVDDLTDWDPSTASAPVNEPQPSQLGLGI